MKKILFAVQNKKLPTDDWIHEPLWADDDHAEDAVMTSAVYSVQCQQFIYVILIGWLLCV